MTLLDDSVAAGLAATRITAKSLGGKKTSYLDDNPVEGAAVIAYLKGGNRPIAFSTQMAKHLVDLEDARREGYAPPVIVQPPPTNVNPLFATKLPKRQPEYKVEVVNVNSFAELTDAATNAAANTNINISTSLVGNGSDYFFRPKNQGIMVTATPGVTITRVGQWVTSNGYVRYRKLALSLSSCFKVDSAYVEYDDCYMHHNTAFGVLFGSPASNVQIWNSTIHNCGSDHNYDHNIYAAHTGGPGSVIARCLLYDPWAYNIQAYSAAEFLIITQCTLDGGVIQVDDRGGIVYGGSGTFDSVTVGCIVTNAPAMPAFHMDSSMVANSRNRVLDCLEFNNVGAPETHSGMTYDPYPVLHADPLYVNRAIKDFHLKANSPAIKLIQPKNFGYATQYDKDGVICQNADAGCFTFVG